MQSEAQHHVVGCETAAFGDVGGGVSERAGGVDRGAGGRGFRTEGLREEERGDPVAEVAADQTAGVDDALIGRADETSGEREVVRGCEPPGETMLPSEG